MEENWIYTKHAVCPQKNVEGNIQNYFLLNFLWVHVNLSLKITITMSLLGKNGGSVPTLVPSLPMALFKLFVQTFDYLSVNSLSV